MDHFGMQEKLDKQDSCLFRKKIHLSKGNLACTSNSGTNSG